MGAIVGLMVATGVLLVVIADGSFGQQRRAAGGGWAVDRLARRSGIARLTGVRLIGICLASGVISGAVVIALTALPIAAALAVIAGCAVPILLIRRRIHLRRRALRQQWPDAIDSLVSAVRAGMSLPESLCALAIDGPTALRPAFAEFAVDYRAAGSFDSALRLLGEHLADPVADRVIAALRIAREVGGADLAAVLRTVNALVRDDARVRGELEGRQSWTVNAARLAIAAPWVTLALLSTRPQALDAYRTSAGAVILIVAALASLLAYRVMLWIGRLPEEERVIAA